MKILMIHNYYRSQNPSGENQSFGAEVGLLRSHGHEVIEYTRNSDEIQDYSLIKRMWLGKRVIWAEDSHRTVKSLLSFHKPDLVHIQNTFPLISPSVIWTCKDAGVPVIQSLRNYRLMCLNGLFYRAGKTCEDCVGLAVPVPGMLHACYRESRVNSIPVATLISFHRLIKTWDIVNRFIAISNFARAKYIENGLPADRIDVKPNFVDPDPGVSKSQGDYFVFIGRLSPEKGVWTLMKAWKRHPDYPLKVVGDGPSFREMQSFVKREGLVGVEFVGKVPQDTIFEIIKPSRAVLFPSEIYETFGKVIIESFACGVPVICSRYGAFGELVDEHKTGLYFTPGNEEELAGTIEWAWSNPHDMKEMGSNAREVYEEKYTARINYNLLLDIYRKASGFVN